MDTNQTHDNNYQINSFTKGMNSDTAYDQVEATQYLFGLNIRITNNALLFGDDIDSNSTEQVIAPVPAGVGVTPGSLQALYDRTIRKNKCLCTKWYDISDFELTPNSVSFKYHLIKYTNKLSLTDVVDTTQTPDVLVEGRTTAQVEAFDDLTTTTLNDINDALGLVGSGRVSRPENIPANQAFTIKVENNAGASPERQRVEAIIASLDPGVKFSAQDIVCGEERAVYVIESTSKISVPSSSDIYLSGVDGETITSAINTNGVWIDANNDLWTMKDPVVDRVWTITKHYTDPDDILDSGYTTDDFDIDLENVSTSVITSLNSLSGTLTLTDLQTICGSALTGVTLPNPNSDESFIIYCWDGADGYDLMVCENSEVDTIVQHNYVCITSSQNPLYNLWRKSYCAYHPASQTLYESVYDSTNNTRTFTQIQDIELVTSYKSVAKVAVADDPNYELKDEGSVFNNGGYPYQFGIAGLQGNSKTITYFDITESQYGDIRPATLTDWGILINYDSDNLVDNVGGVVFEEGLSVADLTIDVDMSKFIPMLGEEKKVCFFLIYDLYGGSDKWTIEDAIEPFEDRILVQSTVQPKGNIKQILAADSIEDIGAIVTKNLDNTWTLYKATYLPDLNNVNLDEIYTSSVTTNCDKFSIVLVRETKSVLKVYIADGINPAMCFFLENDEIEDLYDYYSGADDILFAASNSYFPVNRPILRKIAGNLKTQQVQYTYQFYRRYGCASKLCPLSNKIQIISDNRDAEEGNAEDTTTNVGIRLTLNISEKEATMFNYVRAFRVSYIKSQQEPEITLFYDKSISGLTYDTENNVYPLSIDDTGVESLAQYTIEEFAALETQTIVPKCIESSQGYLFQANAKDRTIIESLTGLNCALEPAMFEMCIDDGTPFVVPQPEGISLDSQLKFSVAYEGTGSNVYHIPNWSLNNSTFAVGTSIPIAYENTQNTYYTLQDYLNDCSIDVSNSDDTTYNNMFISSVLRSIRADDDYRYGIVYYDKYGRRSDVYRIGLYEGGQRSGNYAVENLNVPLSTHQFRMDGTDGKTYARIFGTLVRVNKPTTTDGTEIVGYEIVRCEKSFNYTKNLLQVALSRPLTQGKNLDDSKRTPYYPNVYLSSDFYYIHYKESDFTELWSTGMYCDRGATNVENFDLYQAFSPEITVRRKDLLSKLKSDKIKITPYRFVTENEHMLLSSARLENSYVNSDASTSIYLLHWVQLETQTGWSKNTAYSLRKHEFGSNDAPLYLKTTLSPGLYRIRIPLGLITNSYNGFVALKAAITTDTNRPSGAYATLGTTVNTSYGSFTYLGTSTYNKNKYALYSFNISNLVGRADHLHLEIPEFYGSDTVLEYATSVYQSALEDDDRADVHKIEDGVYVSYKRYLSYLKSNKSGVNAVFKFNDIDNTFESAWNSSSVAIKNVADVKNPGWNDGFSDVTQGGSGTNVVVKSAVKQYKSYSTSIGGKTYNNWVSNGMYDMATTEDEASTQPGNTTDKCNVFNRSLQNNVPVRPKACGFIGPGPVCLLLNTADASPSSTDINTYGLYKQNGSGWLGTLTANITHDTIEYSDTNQIYYGFGNFRKFDGSSDVTAVFDGEIYPDFAEFTNMFKTYNFMERTFTLISAQTVYYIPLASTINSYFDYGQNYRNTNSANLMLEPGQIEGIASQERPLHQYNNVYSDNDWSINTFFESPEKKSDNEYPLRIYYSQLKTNGEAIDNWLITKPADFIDADSKYGQITNMLAQDNTMYFWQEVAFGKLSVNERSLVTDDNGEHIQLGQGGVLQRTDYISTKYGMREQDYSAVNTEDAVFWIDILNKAVVMCRNNQVMNYGEMLNVQNILNTDIVQDIPTIHYDLQNNELLCKCLSSGKQLVFNTKYGYASSVYTRNYDDAIIFNNTVVGMHINSNSHDIEFVKYNNIKDSEFNNSFLPTVISFVVNSSPSQTKVFDNQKIVTMARTWNAYAAADTPNPELPNYLKKEYTNDQANYFTNKLYKFETSIKLTSSKPNAMTDREGNICYDIPREGSVSFDTGYGNRMRGKWLKVTIQDNAPKKDYCISHVVTKFRQSYS